MNTQATDPGAACTRGSPRHSADRGAIQIAAAIGFAGLLLIPLLFAAALLETDNSTNGQNDCGQPITNQPGTTTTATTDIPATYLRLYEQTGQRYGLPWNLLAAIGKIESDHGRDPSPGVKSGANSAGAAGPMQIGIGGLAGNTWGGTPRHPTTQHTSGIGTDGNDDGWVDVYDPADAIPGAARYLLAHGAPGNLTEAVFAYNHDNTYVHQVLTQATQYATGNFQPITDTDTDPAACPGDVNAFVAMPGGVASKVLAYAQAQLSKPYVYGGVGPDSFDCSGLTMMAYKTAGISIPRLANYQYFDEPKITPGHEQPGDLIFFPGSDGTPTDPGHVGIVTNPTTGTMIVAPHTGTNIQYQSYKNYPGGPVGFTRPSGQ